MAGITLYIAFAVFFMCALGSIPTKAHDYGSHTINSMIVGGEPIEITEVPFMAYLRTTKHPLYCGASIIHERFLITAAHCTNISGLFVNVGTDRTDEGGKAYEIEKIFNHPNYSDYYDYDLAVIKLKEKLIWSDKVAPIEIATSLPNDGDILDTMGFGQTEDDLYSKVLLHLKVPYVNKEACEDVFFSLSDRHICAGGEEGKSPCSGDSGSALRDTEGKLLGTASYMKYPQCGKDGNPAVFAYVPAMRKFIDDIIKNHA